MYNKGHFYINTYDCEELQLNNEIIPYNVYKLYNKGKKLINTVFYPKTVHLDYIKQDLIKQGYSENIKIVKAKKQRY